MKYFIPMLLVLVLFLTTLWAQDEEVITPPPERSGIALGYMTTPNSIVYRTTWNETGAFDFWVDLPEIVVGDIELLELGAGFGYAMFFARNEHACFMFRPQLSVRYLYDSVGSLELGIGAAGAVVAYLDSLGIPDTDIYAGISLGAVGQISNNISAFHLILTQRRPFGLVIGVMKYF